MPMKAGAVAAPIVGGIVGNLLSQGDRSSAQAAYAKAYSQYDNVNIPDIQKQQLALQDLQQQGVLTPAMAQAIQVNGSNMANIQTDPKLMQAQMQALQTMQQMGQTGLTSQDLASLAQVQRQNSGQEQAQQGAILSQMAQRGLAGGGAELAAKLQGAQGASDNASQQSMQILADAQNRMLNATAQAGNLGGQIQGEQFGEQAQVASAKDLIAQFNAQQQAQTQASNLGSYNQAQAANLASKQNIANANVATANAQQQYNKNLLQQQYNNQMSLASARSNAAVGQGNQYMAQAGQTGAMWSGIGAGIGQGLMGAANMGKPTSPKLPTQSTAGDAYRDPSIMTAATGGVVTPRGMAYGGITGGHYIPVGSYKDGGMVPGEANVPGDSTQNDTVPAKLSPGEIVIPRSHAISPDLAKAYIDHLHKVAKGKA